MFDFGLFFSIVAQEAVSPRAIIAFIFGALLIAVAKTVVAPTLASSEASKNERTTYRSGRLSTTTNASSRSSSVRISAPSLFLMRLRSTDPRSVSISLVRHEQHPREARTIPVYAFSFHAGDEAVEYDFKDLDGDSPFLNGDIKRVRYLISLTQWVGGLAPRPGERNKRGVIARPKEKLLEFSERF